MDDRSLTEPVAASDGKPGDRGHPGDPGGALEPLELLGVRAVMVFSDDPAGSCRWWANLLGLEMHTEDGFCWVDTPAGIELGFHPSDDGRNPFGSSTVPYWRVPDLDAALARLEAAGARRHRGPIRVDPTRRIAQVTDPFGVVMGIDGP